MSLWRQAVAEGEGLVLGHRGARSLAPENTLAAAEKAFDLGARGWELDVRLSADLVPMVIHDDCLERTSDARARFPRDSPWETDRYDCQTLQSLDSGSWFRESDPFGRIKAGEVEPETSGTCRPPTLEEALELTRARDRLVNVEIKDLSGRSGHGVVVEKTMETVERTKTRDRVLISSSNPDYLREVRALDPEIPLGLLLHHSESDPLSLVREVGADFLHPRTGILSGELIRHLTRNQVPVLFWTVNDPDEGESLLAAGAAGLITDFPQLLLRRAR